MYQKIAGFKCIGSFRVDPIAVGLASIFNPDSYRAVSRNLHASRYASLLDLTLPIERIQFYHVISLN